MSGMEAPMIMAIMSAASTAAGAIQASKQARAQAKTNLLDSAVDLGTTAWKVYENKPPTTYNPDPNNYGLENDESALRKKYSY